MEELPTNLRPELLLNHVAWLRRLAGTLVVDAARADDVVQATLLEALERPPARVEHPRSWLAAAARNLARTFGRAERRREENERRGAVDQRQPATDDVVARTELHHQIVGAVLALAEPYRTAVLLRFFEDLKPGAIARRVGVPVETVRTRLKRGIELLRADLIRRRADPSKDRAAPPKFEQPGEWAVALVGLLDAELRSTVRRALLAKAAGAGAAGAIGASSLTGALGGLAMATKWKVAAAIAVVAAGAFVASKFGGSLRLLPSDSIAQSAKGPAELSPTQYSDESPRVSPERTSLERSAKSSSIQAEVVDEQGTPIEGANVGVLVGADESFFEGDAPPLDFVAGSTATTRASGECDVALPIGDERRIVDLAATADGFNAALWKRARTGETIFLTLTHACELSGIVRDLSGAPIAGATIRWAVYGPRRVEASTTSGADGSYRLATYPGSFLRFGRDVLKAPWITVTADGFASMNFSSSGNVRREGDGTYRLDPWLVRGATIRGSVVDLVGGTPIADADVWLRAFDVRFGGAMLRTKSASDGTFAIDHVPAWGVQLVGSYSSDVSGRNLGELCVMVAGRGFDSRAVALPDDGAQLTFELKLAPIGGVRGRVVDSRGAPVARVFVYPTGRAGAGYWNRGDLNGRPVERKLTDETGRYEIENLAIVDGAATTVPINARVEFLPDYTGADAQAVVRLVAGQIVEAPDLVLKPVAGAVVHVVDEAGRDVAGAIVNKWIRGARGLSHDDGYVDSKTGSTGLCFLPLPSPPPFSPRPAIVAVSALGFAPVEKELESEVASVNIALGPEHRLRGVIRDNDGRLGGGHVVAIPARDSASDFERCLRTGEFWKNVTNAVPNVSVPIGTGRFLLRGLGPGPWHVAATQWGKEGDHPVGVVANVIDESKEVEIVFAGSAVLDEVAAEPLPSETECGRVEVTLTDSDAGKPILRAGSLKLRSGKTDREAVAIAPGRFEFGLVAAGTWQLQIDVPGAAHETRSVVVTAGQTTSVAISIRRGAVARGRLRLAGLPPFTSGRVLLESDDGGAGAMSEIGSDGSFEAPGLVAGKTYRMWVGLQVGGDMPSLWVSDEPARSAAESVDWTPHLVPAGGIVVRFREGDHFPDRVVIRVFDHAGNLVYTCSTARESGIERVLPVGDYVVKVEVPGLETQEQSVAVRQNERATELYFKSR